ncbi:MAG: HAD family phosphatase, partial [Anaerolineales bacterium]
RTDGYRSQLGQIDLSEHEANVARVLGFPPEESRTLFTAFFAGDRLDTDLVDFIRTLKKNYTTAVLSNYGSRLRWKITDLWKIGDAFDHLVISSEVGLMKPDPMIYQIALEATGSLPHEAVFIDDAPENVAAAQAVGMHAIRFTTPQATIQQLQYLLAK